MFSDYQNSHLISYSVQKYELHKIFEFKIQISLFSIREHLPSSGFSNVQKVIPRLCFISLWPTLFLDDVIVIGADSENDFSIDKFDIIQWPV